MTAFAHRQRAANSYPHLLVCLSALEPRNRGCITRASAFALEGQVCLLEPCELEMLMCMRVQKDSKVPLLIDMFGSSLCGVGLSLLGSLMARQAARIDVRRMAVNSHPFPRPLSIYYRS
jgi:hypothetical protein